MASSTANAEEGSNSLIGQVIQGRFEVQERLAAGGMGVVYRAIQRPLGRPVAFKILELAGGTVDASFQQRFFLEAASAAKLAHPNTIVVFDYGRSDEGLYFIVMEYLEGETLHRRLKKRGPLRPIEAIHVGLQIVSSLADAHQHGLVHRDLKPGNIMFAPRAGDPLFVKVLDFGLVKMVGDTSENLGLTRSGMVLGSPQYMAPEQVLGRPIDGRTDIYAMGAVLCHMLTGSPPFGAASSLDSMKHQVQTQPPPLRQLDPQCTASAELEAIVLRCLAKNPDDRFPSMEALMDALRAAHAQEGGVSSGSYLVPHAELSRSQAEGDTPRVSAVPAPSPSQQNRTVRFDSGATPTPSFVGGEASGGHAVSGERSAPSLTYEPAPSGAMSQVSPPRSRTLAMVGAVALALTLVAGIGVVGYFVVAKPAANVSTTTPTTSTVTAAAAPSAEEAPAVVAPPEPPPSPAPPAPVLAQAPVDVILRSTPPGARVRLGEEEVGATPLPLPIPAGETWELTIDLDGYESRTVRVRANSPELMLHLVEAPQPVAGRSRPRPRPATPAPGGSAPPARGGGDVAGPRFGVDMNNPWAN